MEPDIEVIKGLWDEEKEKRYQEALQNIRNTEHREPTIEEDGNIWESIADPYRKNQTLNEKE